MEQEFRSTTEMSTRAIAEKKDATPHASNELDFDGLMQIACGHTAFQLLWAGVRLNVFEILSLNPNLSKEELAEKLGLELQPARILMTGLATLKLVKKTGDRFANAALTEEILTRKSKTNMIDVLGWQAHIVYPSAVDLIESLKQNTNVGLRHFAGDEDNIYHRLPHNPLIAQVFHDAMSSLSASVNSELLALEVFSQISHLVDAGGGDGTNAIALAKAYPSLRVTIFDGETACALARPKIVAAGLHDRVDTWAGDFFVDPFPKHIDAVFFGHMMTIWSPARDTALLRRAYDALPKGGRVLVFNMMGNDDEVGPMSAALGSPYFLTTATGQGMLYTWKEQESFLRDAGFAQTHRLVLPRDHGVLVGVK